MKVAIAGYGLEGEQNYRYFTAAGHDVTIVDEKLTPDNAIPDTAKTLLGPDVFEQLQSYDVVIRTAGLAPRKIKTNGIVWSATNEFFARCQAPIIGVTGSKGKGTTCSLITSILREAGHTVHLVGNIGVSALEQLPNIATDHIVVYELSSFQLWDAVRSPQVSVILYIEPEHLDIHEDFSDYLAAKSHIAVFQTQDDLTVYNANNDYAAKIGQASQASKSAYGSQESAHVHDGDFYYGTERLCSVSQLHLPGRHNQDNACAAIAAVRRWVQDGEVIGRGLAAFGGLDHRLKFVREVYAIKYYDDSIATTPGSAIAALAAFDEPKVLILGGSSKGADFDELAEKVVDSHVRSVLLIGDEAPKIAQSLQKVRYEAYQQLGVDVTMLQIVKTAQAAAEPGDVVILSPSCASFGMFRNYKDRGDQFIAAVKAL